MRKRATCQYDYAKAVSVVKSDHKIAGIANRRRRDIVSEAIPVKRTNIEKRIANTGPAKIPYLTWEKLGIATEI